jgi:hypothetical protein
MPDASPFWQNAFLVGVIVVVGWCVWSGWRAGVVRAALAIGGMIAGGFIGFGVGGAAAAAIGRFVPLPTMILTAALAVVIGLGVYFAAWFLGALLFKRTAQQGSLLLRLFYGVGGALLGLFLGVTIVWSALLLVRGLGGFYEGAFTADRRAHLPTPGAAAAALVKLKRSIEAGTTGRSLVAFDVMPEKIYHVFEKLGRVAASPAAARRLVEYPPVQGLLTDPHLVALTSDPEAGEALQSGGIGSLLKNRHLVAALNDPALIARVQKIDIEKALDYALAAPAPQSHPAHTP